MAKRVTCALLLILAAGCTSQPTAAGLDHAAAEISFTPVNVPAHLSTASFELFVPAGTVRAVVAISAHGAAELYSDPAWRSLAARQQVALLRFRVEKFTGGRVAPAADGDGLAALRQALREHFAVVTGRRELQDPALIFVGHGSSSAQACYFADLRPSATVAVVALESQVGRTHPRLSTGLGTRLPQLHTFKLSEAEQAREFHQHACSFSGLVTLAPHGPATPTFALRWIETILRLRSPAPPAPGRELLLRQVHEDEGYLGTFALDPGKRWDVGQTAPFGQLRTQRATATWLPDAACAEAWRTLVPAPRR